MNETERLQFQEMQRQIQDLLKWKGEKEIQQISYPLDDVSKTIIGIGSSTADDFLETLRPTEVTISSGAITVSQTYHTVDTEGDAATDDLDTINDTATLNETALLILRADSSSRTVVLKDGTGNLRLAGDCTLDHNRDTITLIGTGGVWYELARSNNDS